MRTKTTMHTHTHTPQNSRNRPEPLTRSSTQKKNELHSNVPTAAALLSSQTKREIPYEPRPRRRWKKKEGRKWVAIYSPQQREEREKREQQRRQRRRWRRQQQQLNQNRRLLLTFFTLKPGSCLQYDLSAHAVNAKPTNNTHAGCKSPIKWPVLKLFRTTKYKKTAQRSRWILFSWQFFVEKKNWI